ncbi:MAG TPA: hypothetical protein VLB45_07465 [Nitrosopumilaceae archaeon]|nr:hypothetical protein [Nitrosopumilaceae archaeon]
MGYLGNHLATVVTSIFAATLTGLYFVLPPATHFILIIAIIATWFLAFICWIAQKSNDYMHKHGSHEVKKKLTENTSSHVQSAQISSEELNKARVELSTDLDALRDKVMIKDKEIENLKKEISNLKTLVEIESIRTELANLKMLASQENSKRKTKKK